MNATMRASKVCISILSLGEWPMQSTAVRFHVLYKTKYSKNVLCRWEAIFTAKRHSIAFHILYIHHGPSCIQHNGVTSQMTSNQDLQTINHCRYFPPFCISDISQLIQFTFIYTFSCSGHSIMIPDISLAGHHPCSEMISTMINNSLEVIPDFSAILAHINCRCHLQTPLCQCKCKYWREYGIEVSLLVQRAATVHALFIEFTI